MFERTIAPKKVRLALETDEIIEDYSDEMPEPSRLILGFQSSSPFHVVSSGGLDTEQVTVITVYVPDPEKWRSDHRTRK
jgi:hypothetical protein